MSSLKLPEPVPASSLPAGHFAFMKASRGYRLVKILEVDRTGRFRFRSYSRFRGLGWQSSGWFDGGLVSVIPCNLKKWPENAARVYTLPEMYPLTEFTETTRGRSRPR